MRTGLLIFACLLIGCNPVIEGPRGGDRRPPAAGEVGLGQTIEAARFGLVGDGKTDDGPALQRALDLASESGATVVLPAGTFLHADRLIVRSAALVGRGAASVLKAVGPPDRQAVALLGQAPALRHIVLDSDATRRTGSGGSAKVMIDQASDFEVTDVEVRNAYGAGIIAYSSRHGRILRNRVAGTHADGIHITRACSDITVEDNVVRGTGDDGIAVVSYVKDGEPVRQIVIRRNTVVDNRFGRNISVVGGQDVDVLDNRVAGNLAGLAGILVASESRYDIQGVRGVRISGNEVRDVAGGKAGYGAITVVNSNAYSIDKVDVRDNRIVNSGKSAVLIKGDRLVGVAVVDNIIAGAATQAVLNLTRGQGVTIAANRVTGGATESTAAPQSMK